MKDKGYKLVTARFTDDLREVIEALWEDENGEIVSVYCQASDNDAEFKMLMEEITLDQLHDNTWAWIKEQEKVLEDAVVHIANKRGLIVSLEGNELNAESYKAIVSALFVPFDPEKDKEKLFLLKLELFEMPFIKAHKGPGSQIAKKKIRQAESPTAAISAAMASTRSAISCSL